MSQRSVTQFAYRRHPDQERTEGKAAHHPVIIVGAGPVGLSLAIDLAQRGQAVVLLDDTDRIGDGSRAICFSKRSLELWDRLGVGERMVEKGIAWKVGKIFLKDEMVYRFDLLPEEGHKMPAFINLQQYYAEAYLVDRVQELPLIDLRWRNKVVGLEQHNDHAIVEIETPDGRYKLKSDFVIACDGARSALRGFVGAEFSGESFNDRFLIADVKMTAAFPTERWLWFDPPFHSGQSALLHRQPDDVWRIDLQLGPDADPAVERLPENVRPRIERMLGHSEFEFEWISIYKFQCRRMQRFIHGRVLFAGDSAHQVSPFGARGANSGLEDAENLAWKLALVLRGKAAVSLLDSYESERSAAADENIRVSTHSTDFIAPHSKHERRMRHAVLRLAKEVDFARRMVNGGRLSTPSTYNTHLSTRDVDTWRAGPPPGAHIVDAPLTATNGERVYLTEAFKAAGGNFVLLKSGNGSALAPLDCHCISIGQNAPLHDISGLFAKRYDASDGTAYLLRPDGYVAARFRHPTLPAVQAAIARASALIEGTP
ncbi:monooxygenase, FAD-binding protein [Nitrobacter hamburgensis X14]|uniref:Monooxygenase, FAD-binding protein n=1 Tax=Nitrobacter hamburgensis (strain DSM 10229 / NCIMB 13809 / X14) TaxID=323097 RepID=Q1QPR5_NITHX|nr:FAD-dependent oxidoreductase [Nitrobacter hamburgensis]ABE61782.1 monooxygenase, FAD-binding protein [Nitrobacter hamburgensis X14]